MSLLNAVVLAAETPVQMALPTWAFPLIAACVFVALGFVVWSFRDVANRHSHKVRNVAGTGGTNGH